MNGNQFIRLHDGQALESNGILLGEISWIAEQVEIIVHKSAMCHPQLLLRTAGAMDPSTADLIGAAAGLAWARGSFDEYGSIIVKFQDVLAAAQNAPLILLL